MAYFKFISLMFDLLQLFLFEKLKKYIHMFALHVTNYLFFTYFYNNNNNILLLLSRLFKVTKEKTNLLPCSKRQKRNTAKIMKHKGEHGQQNKYKVVNDRQ